MFRHSLGVHNLVSFRLSTPVFDELKMELTESTKNPQTVFMELLRNLKATKLGIFNSDFLKLLNATLDDSSNLPFELPSWLSMGRIWYIKLMLSIRIKMLLPGSPT